MLERWPERSCEELFPDCHLPITVISLELQIMYSNFSDKYCSRLSPHLTNGTLSVKEVYKRIKDFKNNCEKKGLKYNKRGLSAFSSRLSWRCLFDAKGSFQ